MKILTLAICLTLLSCSQEEQKPPPKVHHEEPPPPPPPPAVTNPFEKPPPPPPVPVRVDFKNPTWIQLGPEFKLNDTWSFWTWRDSTNHVTCYLYTLKDSTQNGISCVKE